MKQILILILLFNIYTIDAQKYYGYIVDCDSKETLLGATISDKNNNNGVTTNTQGYFMIFSENTTESLNISYIGYKSKTIPLTQFVNGSTICLEKGYQLDEVVIQINAGEKSISEKLNVVSIPIEDAKRVPMILGEVDIIKALQTKPGISQGYEGSAGLFVRGGTPDQNLFLVDDNPLYNSSHLLGFLSAVNGDAIKTLDLHKGYFPPKFGGRLSSIVDIQMKDGDKNKRVGEYSIGLLSSKIGYSLPLLNNKVTLSANARSTYLNLVGLALRNRYKNFKSNTYDNYWFYDINVKLHYIINNKNHLYLNFFNGYDFYKNYKRVGSNDEQITKNIWGSSLAGLRYTNFINSNLIMNYTLGLNRYNSDIIGNSVLSDQNINSFFKSYIAGIVSKVHFDYFAKKHKLNFGIENKIEDVFPGKITDPDGVSKLILDSKKLLTSNALYFEDEWKISKVFRLQTGVRYNYLTGNDFRLSLLEPRAQLSTNLSKNDVIRISYNKMHQNVGFLANNGLAFPTDFWLPSFNRLPVSTADHYSIGFGKSFKKWSFISDIFYKNMKNLIGLKPGTDYFNYRNSVINNIDLGIEGRVRGLELGINYTSNKISTWLSYTLSKNERRLDGTNNGEWYPFNYDKTHELSLVFMTKLPKNWEISTAFNYSTGRTFTLPSTYANTTGNSSAKFIILPIYEQYNNVRFPDNHRLDLSFIKNFDTSKLSFGFYNTYAQNNPFYLEYSLIGQNQSINPRIKKVGLFGPIPFINFTKSF